jgi:hypothetical protein
VFLPSTPTMKSPTANAPLEARVKRNLMRCAQYNTAEQSRCVICPCIPELSRAPGRNLPDLQHPVSLTAETRNKQTKPTTHLHAAACNRRQHEAYAALHRRARHRRASGGGDWLRVLQGSGSSDGLLLRGKADGHYGCRSASVHGSFNGLGRSLRLRGICHGDVAQPNRRPRHAHDDKSVLALSLLNQ